MEKKMWNNPGFIELGVENTECIPTVPSWTNSSGNTSKGSCGWNFGYNSGSHHKIWWW